ncbi:MAG TPA: S41 family peptidase [Chitinophagaceae bacterium]|nr:S41 family peptidase [Chitinophagaceae bacterium]
MKNIILLAALAVSFTLFGQNTQKGDIKITDTDRNLIIETTITSLNEHYISNELAVLIGKTIQERNKKGHYSRIKSGSAFSDTLTKQLREISKDEHLGLIFSVDSILPEQSNQPTAEEREKFKRFASTQNYGFEKLERLQGNIGYMELDGFIRPEWGSETAIAALNFLSNTDALIIDLRYNGGGEPGLIQLICSYFFEKPTHLNSIYWREDKRTQQFWTMPYVSGKKYLDKPIFILTGKNTFSAAEDFAYSLQALKRVVIIGNKTKGGANAGKTFPINDHFQIYIPIGKAINPITGKNWEGGVIPDIEVDSKEALKKATKVALQTLIDKTESPQKKQMLRAALQELD